MTSSQSQSLSAVRVDTLSCSAAKLNASCWVLSGQSQRSR